MNGLNIEEMIARYGDDILRLCLLYLGDRQLAEDAFQETFVKAWKGRDAFRGESSEKTWLSRIAVNTCRDMLRSGWFRLMKRSEPVEALFDLPRRRSRTPRQCATRCSRCRASTAR